jgi:4-amino-4-deoxy-L-arabinose transferase-like glycosyltransferase
MRRDQAGGGRLKVSPGTHAIAGWLRRRLPQQDAVLLFAGFALATFVLRLPSLFEPPWHTDEGIFQAVAQRVASGGSLYADAWESKPPLFLYIHVLTIEVLGPGVMPVRAVAMLFALGAALAFFAVALRFTSRPRALAAAGLLLAATAAPFWEGNLALTETFVLLPSLLAVLLTLKGLEGTGRARAGLWLGAGAMFAAAVLIRQTAAVIALALVLWLLLCGRPWLRLSAFYAAGALLVLVPVLGAFAVFGSWRWFWDANAGFFLQYVPSGEQLPFHYRPLIVLPVVAGVVCLALQRRLGRGIPAWGFAALWYTLTLAAALLTGRPYPHYFLQTLPPLCLLAVMAAAGPLRLLPSRWSQAPALALSATVLALWLLVVRPQFEGNLWAMRYTKGPDYYPNFAAWAMGWKSDAAYNDYFDRRVNLTRRLEGAISHSEARAGLYVWGEYPWLYALSESKPASRYMTSFYTLLLPGEDERLADSLRRSDPRLIVVLVDAWPKYYDSTGVLNRRYLHASSALNGLLAERYVLALDLRRARVYRRSDERPLVTPFAGEPEVMQEDGSDAEAAEMLRR